jgi:glycosyltransferase involved in cell wall biosynthesis
VLKNRWLIALLEALEMWAYRQADLVVVVTEGFRSTLIARGIPADKVVTIRNGVDIERFAPPPDLDVAAERKRLGAEEGDCLVLYIGAHGISQGLTTVADAAALLTDEPIHFAFVGEGAAKEELERHVARLDLDNVTMLPGVPRDEVPAILAAADICLAPLRDVPLFTTFIPSKIFEYFAAGKAVVGAVRGETAELLHEAGAEVVKPQDHIGLGSAIRTLAQLPDRRALQGARARTYAATNFDRRILAQSYRRLLRDPSL